MSHDKAKQICVSCRKPSGAFAECVRCRAKKRYARWKRKFFEGRKGQTLLSHYSRTTIALPLNFPTPLVWWNLSRGIL